MGPPAVRRVLQSAAMPDSAVEPAIPLPPEDYQRLVCGYEGNFEAVGRGLVRVLSKKGLAAPETDLLDVGCGCGRAARYLLGTPIRSYVGFDRHPGMIQWCQEFIASRDTRFTFECFDLQSLYERWDQRVGSLSASEFRFPYRDGQFNAALLSSVFTHMPKEEVCRYLHELRRVVRPGGKVFLTLFLSDRYYVDDINAFYPPAEFAGLVEAAGLTVADGPPSDHPMGYRQASYLLEHRPVSRLSTS